MGIIHFLNVKNGDCSIVQHPSGRITVIDVCNAYEQATTYQDTYDMGKSHIHGGNFNQKEHPVNPIDYLRQRGIAGVFRFILTHPDMDHMDGLKAFCAVFRPLNFWDTDNAKEIPFSESSIYRKEDWLYYKSIRDGTLSNGPKRLVLYAGARGPYYNQDDTNGEPHDNLYILAPTRELMDQAKTSDDYNDASYVILYRSEGGRVLFAGDSHDRTWDYILDNYAKDVRNVELLIAPHHGRKSGRSYKFLDVVNPGLTLLGNADSEHLAYEAWRNRGFCYITNNQAGCIIIDASKNPMSVYVTNESYVRQRTSCAPYDDRFQAYYCGNITPNW